MEFPDLGRHCEHAACKQLDFLPFKCDGCSKTFCLEHRSYQTHSCPNPRAHMSTNDVPSCPMCSQPVPVHKGETIDRAVDRHINGGCVSEQKQRQDKNRCTMKGCRKSELIPFKCNSCRQQFCMRHRFSTDHQCPVPKKNDQHMFRFGPFNIPIKSKS